MKKNNTIIVIIMIVLVIYLFTSHAEEKVEDEVQDCDSLCIGQGYSAGQHVDENYNGCVTSDKIDYCCCMQ